MLLYHRVRPDPPAPTDVVRTVTVDRLREQLTAIRRVGEIVPLAELDRRGPGGAPRFAITFDDDDAGHAHHALPVLAELGVPATFFLSGRWLHGLGPYWWELLERELRELGVRRLATQLGQDAGSAVELAVALEGSPAAAELAARADQQPRGPDMTSLNARALIDAGMEIGFHTVDHPVLPQVAPDDLRSTLTRGRDELAEELGVPLRRFAYPHGRWNHRVRDALAEQAYVGAWTVEEVATHPSDHALSRGRWEPGARSGDEVVAGLVRRLLHDDRDAIPEETDPDG